ncbi:peptidylprolyl isomerase [Intestinimonas butyriciproducens]|uniref:peptidylprolyl isomerase n=1 Tax=Intestinimonas butyriciproducens TaxID=1297617 RepID=UPI0018A0FB73|nr:peptidylprolyl isomerase [Intestinimonas butyriciproducens]
MSNTNNPAEMLEQINAAITAVLSGGQSYKIGSRSLTRADLSTLQAMRAELEAQITAGQASPLLDRTYVAFFDGR